MHMTQLGYGETSLRITIIAYRGILCRLCEKASQLAFWRNYDVITGIYVCRYNMCIFCKQRGIAWFIKEFDSKFTRLLICMR